MNIKTKQGTRTLRRAHAFLVGKEFAAAVGDLKPHVEALDGIIVRLEQFSTEQSARNSAARTATDNKRELARELRREYLRPIAQVGRRLFSKDAELRKAFILPKSRDDESLIQTANAFAERVEEFKEKFAARGLAVDLVDRLRKATITFRDIDTSRSLDLARRGLATNGMLSALAEGRDLLRLLDLMLAPRLESQPEKLAEWRIIARFMRSATLVNVETDTTPAQGSDTPAQEGVNRAA